ncbi:hypothetical protein Fot_56456 [Forsythia ovata]|uniref:Uncharacterized protein n=1 Tax=Forsythia ovata TaxID=205694 RepID=A0ABD1NZK2_9LAMI
MELCPFQPRNEQERFAPGAPGPPLSDWTDSEKGQSPPEHASQPLIRPDQIVESISQQFFSPLITPSQPARPIDLVRSANSKGLIWSEVVGTNRLLYRKKLYFGWTPIFNHYSWRRPALRYGRTRRRTQAAEMQKRRAKIPDPVIDSTTNLLNEGSLLTLSH